MRIDKAKVWEWINSYWTAPHNCPVCQNDDWMLFDEVWELGDFHGDIRVIGHNAVLPVVALMCNVCGHTILFNAVAVRAVSKPISREGKDE